MPHSAPHPCPSPGCRTLVVGRGRCSQHRPRAFSGHAPSTARGSGAGWKARRARHLKANPYCACGCGQYAKVYDHRVALALGGVDTEANMQGLAESCSRRKTAIEANIARAMRRRHP